MEKQKWQKTEPNKTQKREIKFVSEAMAACNNYMDKCFSKGKIKYQTHKKRIEKRGKSVVG